MKNYGKTQKGEKRMKKKNPTEIYNEAYIAGYNQSRVDSGKLSQKEADKILRKINKKWKW